MGETMRRVAADQHFQMTARPPAARRVGVEERAGQHQGGEAIDAVGAGLSRPVVAQAARRLGIVGAGAGIGEDQRRHQRGMADSELDRGGAAERQADHPGRRQPQMADEASQIVGENDLRIGRFIVRRR